MGARAQHNPAYRHLCHLLREWRVRKGLTQRALAELLNKPHSYVHKVETGERRIDPVEFIAWCRACALDPGKALRQVERRKA